MASISGTSTCLDRLNTGRRNCSLDRAEDAANQRSKPSYRQWDTGQDFAVHACERETTHPGVSVLKITSLDLKVPLRPLEIVADEVGFVLFT